MLGSIYIGLSGMKAYSKGLQTISNNVANLNSPGFKVSTASFGDIFNVGDGRPEVSGGLDGEQHGGGVLYKEPKIDFAQGDLKQSAGDLDLAVQGSGFLVLKDDKKTFYTRTGQFSLSDDGSIVLQDTKNQLSVLDGGKQAVPLNINQKRTSPPVATTSIKFSDNLSSTGSTATVTNIAVFDSVGGKQVWQAKFDVITGSPGQWAVTVTDQTGRTVGNAVLKFNGGIVDPATSQLVIADNPPGAAPLSITLDFSGNVTNFSAGTSSTLRAAAVDGNGAGNLTTATVDDDGYVTLNYSNEKSERVGVVAVADFRDTQSLQQIGGGLFVDRGARSPRLLQSGADGAGKVVARRLEGSNVDLSQEFGDLILIQRGFQASSQVVSVTNDMIQQLFGIRGQG